MTARYATPATNRPNLLEAADGISDMLGFRLMPWQSEVVRVLTEQENGLAVYSDATILTQRQQGKSMLCAVLMLLRCLSAPDQRVLYASTTGQAARHQLFDEILPVLNRSKLHGMYEVRATNGAERVMFQNGSTISLLSSSKEAGHGLTVDTVFVDEAWAVDASIEQLKPTMLTRPGSQWIVLSTAGTPTDSPWLLERVERGRESFEQTTSSAYFEWSADPGDIGNVDAYIAAAPAVGITVRAEAIRDAVQGMDKSEAARAYGNIFTDSLVEPVVSIDQWNILQDNSTEIDSGLVLAVDVGPLSEHASIAAAGKRADGLWSVEVIDSRKGTAWLPGRLAEIIKKHRVPAVWIDKLRSASLVPDLDDANIRTEEITAQDAAAAFAFFVQTVSESGLRHPEDTELLHALTSATTRPLGDGGQAWSRRSSNVDIDGLVAVTIALWAARQHQVPHVWNMDEIAYNIQTRQIGEQQEAIKKRKRFRVLADEAKIPQRTPGAVSAGPDWRIPDRPKGSPSYPAQAPQIGQWAPPQEQQP